MAWTHRRPIHARTRSSNTPAGSRSRSWGSRQTAWCMPSPHWPAASTRALTRPRSSCATAAPAITLASPSPSRRPAAHSSMGCTARCHRIRWRKSCSDAHGRPHARPRGLPGHGAGHAGLHRPARPPDPDLLLLCGDDPLHNQGLARQDRHVLAPGDIPVLQSNRGGQVTFHGPGQVVAYPLIDLRRAGYYVKEYFYRMEEAVTRCLAQWGVTGHRVAGAPGIYVRPDDPGGHALLPLRPPKSPGNPGPAPAFQGLGKIAALGVKVSRHCSYHGVALNVAMDLEPFARINPCGYAGLRTVDLSTIGVRLRWDEVAQLLGRQLCIWLAP